MQQVNYSPISSKQMNAPQVAQNANRALHLNNQANMIQFVQHQNIEKAKAASIVVARKHEISKRLSNLHEEASNDMPKDQ